MNTQDSIVAGCYQCIKERYGDRTAKRSGVPYINHIDEGLRVLDHIGASYVAKAAYCIHPIVQSDEDVVANLDMLLLHVSDRRVLMTAMEYRNVANRGLHCHQVDNPDAFYLGPFKDVRAMLIADKVQNRKDFLIHHYGTHDKSIELDRYFCNWLRALAVSEHLYYELVAVMRKT